MTFFGRTLCLASCLRCLASMVKVCLNFWPHRVELAGHNLTRLCLSQSLTHLLIAVTKIAYSDWSTAIRHWKTFCFPLWFSSCFFPCNGTTFPSGLMMLARSFNLTFDAYRFEYKIIERVANETCTKKTFFFFPLIGMHLQDNSCSLLKDCYALQSTR